MSNVGIISIQYAATMALARALAAEGESIKKKSTGKLVAQKAEIYQAWRGENANFYLQKMDTLGQKMTNNAEGIKESARAIKQMAYNYYKAELYAIEIARRKSF